MSGAAWVFHRGALGDSILTWPMLRAMRMEFDEVAFVADGEKAALAERVLNSEENQENAEIAEGEFCTQRAQRARRGDVRETGEGVGVFGRGRGVGVVIGVDAEQGFFSSFWREGGVVDSGMKWPARLARGPRMVVALLGGGERAELWCGNVGRVVPGAKVEVIGERLDRRVALRLARAFGGEIEREKSPNLERGAVRNVGGPILLHVGAGSAVKRWAIERFVGVARVMRRRGVVVELIGGEVELERLTREERAAFVGAGGEFVGSLMELERRIRGARVFVGADSGPTHLAGQLGVETVALFGPTEVEAWAPIGPRVRVIGPEGVRGMEWIEEGAVVAAIERALGWKEGE